MSRKDPSVSKLIRLPVITLAIGAVAAIVIATGTLNWRAEGQSVKGKLNEIEFLTSGSATRHPK